MAISRQAISVLFAAALGLAACGSDGGDALSCDQLAQRLGAAADDAMAEFEDSGEMPEESDQVKDWSHQFEEKDCTAP